MEKIVADLDFHGCLLRGARPNRILNRYDRKRERDRGQSAFCVPINHFSPPPYPMNRSPSSWSKPFPILDHPHHMGNDQSSCVKECRGHCYIQTDPLWHSLHQTISRTRAAAALPSVIGGRAWTSLLTLLAILLANEQITSKRVLIVGEETAMIDPTDTSGLAFAAVALSTASLAAAVRRGEISVSEMRAIIADAHALVHNRAGFVVDADATQAAEDFLSAAEALVFAPRTPDDV
jgi:fructose-specific component phosphotransferase system IIB-like protein